MIKKVLVSVLLLLLLTACGSETASAPQNASLPVIVVDDVHFKDSNAIYEIPAGDGFILDAQDYKFAIPAGMGPVMPNYMEVVIRGNVFGMEWQASTPQEVRVGKLQALQGNSQLEQFNSGQQFLVAIGNRNNGHFTAFWTAAVNVK